MGHNKTTGSPVIVLLLKSFCSSSLPSHVESCTCNQSPSSRTPVTLNSQIPWGDGMGEGWKHVDVACKKGFPFVRGSLVGGLTLMSLFHLGRRKKPHRPKSLSLYQRFRTPFDQTTHKRKTHLKNRLLRRLTSKITNIY